MKKLLASAALGLAGVTMTSAPAFAATQRGLVNVNVEDVTVQIPIGIAANVCDVDVAVLAQGLVSGPTDCDATAESVAVSTPTHGRGAHQEGLVNVNLDDVTVLVPVAVAANICDVDVAVLSGLLLSGPTTCDTDAESMASA